MITFRRRLMMMARAVTEYFSAWFRSDGWFRSDPW